MTLMLGLANSRSCRIFSARKRIAAVDQGDVMAMVGQVQRFLDRGVAAADHRDPLAAIEEAVAGRAGGRAPALHMLFGGKVEPFRLSAGRDHQGVGEILRAAIAGQPERPARQIDAYDMVPDDLGADMLGLGLHLLHQPRDPG